MTPEFTPDDTVTIPRARLESLQRAAFKLQCLENGGVDNWGHYEDSLELGGFYDQDED